MGREPRGGKKGRSPGLPRWPSSPMGLTAGVLLWTLLLSLGPRPDYNRDATVSFCFGGCMTHSYPTAPGIPRSRIPPKRRVTVLQGDKVDVVAAADGLASPAAAELLAATVATGLSQSHVVDKEDGSLEEGVVINARKGNNNDETSTMLPIQGGAQLKVSSEYPGTGNQDHFKPAPHHLEVYGGSAHHWDPGPVVNSRGHPEVVAITLTHGHATSQGSVRGADALGPMALPLQVRHHEPDQGQEATWPFRAPPSWGTEPAPHRAPALHRPSVFLRPALGGVPPGCRPLC